MRSLCLQLAVLFLAYGNLSSAQNPDGIPTLVMFELGRPFVLNCSTNGDAASYSWKHNGTALLRTDPHFVFSEAGAMLKVAGRTHESDYGNYSCALQPDGAPARLWDVRARPVAKLPANSNVVENQNFTVTCVLTGKPYPPVGWTYSDEENANGTDVREHFGDRVNLTASAAGVPDAVLRLSKVQRSDAGWFRCTPLSPEVGAVAETRLRVKDQYAALWPFLGICLEVLVLCAIILVYEKRRTKPELDDSDTDNHDQKKS